MADETEAPAEASMPHPMKRLVEKWRADCFPGSVIARCTGCWNPARGAEEAPKTLLTGL